jgi:hypothetical protein
MILALTGYDPRRIISTTKNSSHSLRGLINNISPDLVRLIIKCLAYKRENRPSLEDIRDTLNMTVNALRYSPSVVKNKFIRKIHYNRINKLIEKGQIGLFNNVLVNEKNGLWLSQEIGAHLQDIDSPNFAIYKSVHRGVAGLIYLIGLLARLGYETRIPREKVYCRRDS